MIEVTHLSKSYKDKKAVDDLSFEVADGLVTGLLGPNGAGKSTTMRMMVGLDRPTSGTVTIDGIDYRNSAAPLGLVGTLLDAKSTHPGRSARSHLRMLADTHGISYRRVDDVLDLTGLSSVANRRVGKFSLGMGQRLGIAGALLADPKMLILDEPVNGLDPEGVIWFRSLCRSLAAGGRAVLLSSHLMDEMAKTADRIVVMGRGRLIANQTVGDLIASVSRQVTRVRTARLTELAPLLQREGGVLISLATDTAEVSNLTDQRIAEIAAANGIALFEIAPVQTSLEDAFLELTHDSVEYRETATTKGN